MSNPRDPLTAGDRLNPARRDPQRKPSAPRNGGKKPKKTSILSRIARFFVFGFYRLVFFGAIAAVVGGGVAYLVFSSGLPSVDSLKDYKPPL
ncbi:MAG TPA: penicillin-binding protein, partial [Acidocella sp.]|nr:penicillin-binding protein [Acidocella sp.]